MESNRETSVSSDESTGSSLSGSDDSFDQVVERSQATVEPYQYEPAGPVNSASSPDSSDDDDTDPGNERQQNTNWCTCGNCVIMPTADDCVCCCEIDEVIRKKEESDNQLTCIIDHEGFEPVCLNLHVLQAAYFSYRQQYGRMQGQIHETYRFTAYRQLTWWCWGWLGRRVRVVLPSCAVAKIRNTFPSTSYTGFNYPNV